MIRIPFLGGTEFPKNIGLGSERLINLYPEKNGNKRFLRHTPGAKYWTTAGNGPIRGAEQWDGHLYVLSGNGLYQVKTNGGTAHVGAVEGLSGRTTLVDCGAGGLLILDNGRGYYFDGAGVNLITDQDFPFPAIAATFLDGYAIVVKGGTGEFYIPANTYDLTEWNALDFENAEAVSDNLLNVYADKNLLFLLGERSTEIYTNTGNADFPFEAIRQAMSHFGLASKNTLTFCDGNLYWVGKNQTGGLAVLRLAQGADPEKVSDHRLDDYLSDLEPDVIESAFGLGIWWRGHPWYVLSITLAEGHGRTFVYDVSVEEWFEWSSYSETWNVQGRWRGNDHFYFGGKHIVTDGDSGDLYELRNDVYTDFGLPIVRERRTEIMNTGMEPIAFNQFSLMIETGTGEPGPDYASESIIYLVDGNGDNIVDANGNKVYSSVTRSVKSYTSELSVSRDGGHTWGNSRTKSIGPGSRKDKHVTWRRLGHCRPGEHATFRWMTSSNCPIHIRDGFIRGRQRNQ